MLSLIDSSLESRRAANAAAVLTLMDSARQSVRSRTFFLLGTQLYSGHGQLVAWLNPPDQWLTAPQLAVRSIAFDRAQRVEFVRPSGALQWLPCAGVMIHGAEVWADGTPVCRYEAGEWRSLANHQPICSEIHIR